MPQELLTAKTFAHGVHPPEHKDATERSAVRRMPFAPTMLIPLAQHTGAPARCIVREGQEVVRGEPIAEPGGFVSVAMHAPATGVVARIARTLDVAGRMTPAIFIRVFPGSSQEILYGEYRDMDSLSPEQLVQAVQACGLVGLGGAAFPTHVKLTVPEGKKVEVVLANGCECEPYLTTDHRVMLEQPELLMDGLRLAVRATGASRAVIGIEANKPDAIETLRAKIPEGEPFSVQPLKVKYPQGAEKMLIKAVLRREVPSGGLPIDVDAAVFNVATLTQMADLVPRQQGLIERVITITGPGVERPGNYLIAIGTPLRFALEQVGFSGSANQVIMGGPMMGAAAPSLDIPITKGMSGILVLTEEEAARRPQKTYACIRCGSCVEACPMFLNPSHLGALARTAAYEEMEEQFHLNDCFECGCCTYVCPSNIPLVQYFRVAKSKNRERKAKK